MPPLAQEVSALIHAHIWQEASGGSLLSSIGSPFWSHGTALMTALMTALDLEGRIGGDVRHGCAGACICMHASKRGHHESIRVHRRARVADQIRSRRVDPREHAICIWFSPHAGSG